PSRPPRHHQAGLRDAAELSAHELAVDERCAQILLRALAAEERAPACHGVDRLEGAQAQQEAVVVDRRQRVAADGCLYALRDDSREGVTRRTSDQRLTEQVNEGAPLVA